MEYYSVIKKQNEILPSAATWTDLKGIMLNEISQTEKDKNTILHDFIHGIKKNKLVNITIRFTDKRQQMSGYQWRGQYRGEEVGKTNYWA